MQKSVDELTKSMLPVLKKAGVLRSALFGSYVRGEAQNASDIDVLIEFPKGKSLLDLVRLEQELEDVLGKEVDLVSYNGLHPRLRESILRDQIPIL